MVEKIPEARPTASECLDDPWIVCNDTSSGLFATKRNVSLVTTSAAVHPFKKVFCGTSVGAEEGSTQILKSAMWPGEISEYWNCSLTKDGLSHRLISLSESVDNSKPSSSNHSEIDQLTIKPWVEGEFSVIAHCRYGQLIHGSLMSYNHATADASHVLSDLVTSRETSTQTLARKLLAALKMERYRNDDEVMRQEFERLNITTLHIHQSSRSSVPFRVVRDDRDLRSAFLINSSDANAPGADESHEISINRLPAHPLLEHPASRGNHPWANQLHPMSPHDPHLVLTTEADDGQNLCDTAENHTQINMHERSSCNKSTFDMTLSDNTSIGSEWSSSSAGAKGLTYPSHFDAVMAGLSYCYALPS